MRVRFFSAHDEQETAALLALQRAIDDYWVRFRKVALGPPSRWIAGLRKELQELDPGLGLEVDVRSESERHLYVLPVGGAHCYPLAEIVVARAPSRASRSR